MKIRKAKKSDFKEVFRLLKQLFSKDRIFPKKTKEIYLRLLKDKNSIELILENQGKIIGYSSVVFREDIQNQAKVGYLSELIIDEEERGKGYGAKFLKLTIKSIKNSGAREIHFSSTFKRKKAHKFYESLGFKKTAYFFWKNL